VRSNISQLLSTKHANSVRPRALSQPDENLATWASDLGAEKREHHGSKGSTVFRDPTEEDRVWALFDWDAELWQSFVSDPEVPAILQEAGHIGRPQAAELVGQYNA
jgi:hypothetical protein